MSNRVIIVTYFMFAMFAFAIAALAKAAEAPSPEQALMSCQSELQVTAQYALQQSKSRTAVEQELARVRAQNALLVARIRELSPKSEKPAQ